MIIKGTDTQIIADNEIVSQIANWELNLPLLLEDVTSQGNDWRKREQLLQEWSLLIECFRDASDAGQTAITDACIAGINVTIKLVFATEDTWLLSGKPRMTITAAAPEIIKTRYDLISDGSISFIGGSTYTQLAQWTYAQLAQWTYAEIEG